MRWLTLREAAELTGRSDDGLRLACKAGVVRCRPPVQAGIKGGGWVIAESELERLRSAGRFLRVQQRRNGPRYLPTPEEIEVACAEIRAGWTDEDYLERSRSLSASMVASG